MTLTTRQREVLSWLAKGETLHACDHVMLDDGVSYYFSNGRPGLSAVHANTVYALVVRKLIEPYGKTVGGWKYRLTAAGRSHI